MQINLGFLQKTPLFRVINEASWFFFFSGLAIEKAAVCPSMNLNLFVPEQLGFNYGKI